MITLLFMTVPPPGPHPTLLQGTSGGHRKCGLTFVTMRLYRVPCACSLRKGLIKVIAAYTIASQMRAGALIVDVHLTRVACMAHTFVSIGMVPNGCG